MSTISTIASRSVELTKWTIGLALSAALVGCGGGGEDAVSTLPIVAGANLAAPITAANAAALAPAGAFTFPTGFSGNAGAVVLAGATTVALPTATTFAITNGGGTATGNTTFGSCIFNVTASTVPGIVAPTAITVNPCTLTVDTSGDVVGTTNTDGATLNLGGSSSNSVNVTVTVAADGSVVVNSTQVGTVAVVFGTGATGGGG